MERQPSFSTEAGWEQESIYCLHDRKVKMLQLSGCEGIPAVYFTAPDLSDVLNAGDKENATGSIRLCTRHVEN